jgi:hypothetical protein
MTDWERHWSKQWYTVDSGTVVKFRLLGYSDDIWYVPVLWAIKDRLTSPGLGAWTVLASSGKAGGASLVADTNDNWITADDLVSATSDTADRSWILLKSPTTRFAGTFYLLLDYWGTSSDVCNWYFSKSQPDISSPAVNARPPATGNEWSHLGTIARSRDSSQFIVTMYAVRAHDGSFYIGISAPIHEDHPVSAHHVFNVLRNPRPWDTTKAVSLIKGNQSDRVLYNTTMSFQTLHSDGTQVTVEPVWLRAEGAVANFYTLTDPWTGKWITWPVPMFCTTTGKRCFRGELEDIYFTGHPGGEGTIMFTNEVVKAIRIGPFSVPFDRLGGAP